MKRYVVRRVADGLFWSSVGWAPFGEHTHVLTHEGPEPPHGILMDGETWVRVAPSVNDLDVRSADAIALEAIRDYETAEAEAGRNLPPLPAAAGLARRCRERLDRALAEADRVARG